MKIVDLRTEYLTNPLGIANRRPRFSWRFTSSQPGMRQIKYRLHVASRPDLLSAGQGDAWDSGWVESSVSVAVVYDGKPLVSRERCYWHVAVMDQERDIHQSETAWFEIALDDDDWQALWIGWPAGAHGRALMFRREFELAKPLRYARIYMAGLGLYEFHCNGVKLDDRVLEPAWTDYGKRVLYTVYDLTPLLQPGANVLAVEVGGGWYGSAKLLAQLELGYADGETQIIATGHEGAHWEPRWLAGASPTLANSLYDGETFDSNLFEIGWDRPGFRSRREWWLMPAVPVDPPAGQLLPTAMEPIQVVGELPPVSVTEVSPGRFVYDFGQNFAGWCRLRVKAPAGRVVTVKFAEVLHTDGSINQDNLRTARATDTYICRGDDEEIWEPKFTYHGFRYAELTGVPDAGGNTLTGCVVRSAVAPAGRFECSEVLLNQICRNSFWTESSNLHGLPTDCPQRDERMGWLNDLTARAEAALCHFDLGRLYAKFLDDIADTQTADGAIADTAPFCWGSRPGDPVSLSFTLLPWLLYVHYGDRQPIERHYGHLRQWFDFLSAMTQDDILSYSIYGDWAPPKSEELNNSPVSANTPGALISTGFLLMQARLLAKMADVLGDPADAAFLRQREKAVTVAFDRKFWDAGRQVYASGNQACCVFPLWLGIVPAARQKRVVQTLVDDLIRHDMHITTGNLCTRYLFEVLSQHGRADLAAGILLRRDYPSYGYMIDHGATTIWERWENGGAGMNSYNHPMYGAVALWFYRYLTGIRLDESVPGAGRVIIAPCIVSRLSFARASLDTVRGQVAVHWRQNEETVTLELSIPANMTALVILSAGESREIDSGIHHFEIAKIR